jgi:hypothetical protein
MMNNLSFQEDVWEWASGSWLSTFKSFIDAAIYIVKI